MALDIESACRRHRPQCNVNKGIKLPAAHPGGQFCAATGEKKVPETLIVTQKRAMVAHESVAQLKAQCLNLCTVLQTEIKKESHQMITEAQKNEGHNKATVRPEFCVWP